MVDTLPVQVAPPDPPEVSGPIEGSDEWTKVQGIKDKRREFGAGVAFPTGTKIRHFVLEFRFKEKLDESVADGSTLNLHGLHREYVEKLMGNTEGDAQLIPTAKDKKKTATTTPHPIVNINSFPTSDRLHRLFFNRTIYYDKYNKRTVVKIHHAVLMKETVFAVKQKIFDWLTQKNLWMLAGELDSVETSGIGWMLGAHPYLVFTPDIAARLNLLISRLPQEVIEEKVSMHGTADDLQQLPLLFVNPRDQPFGAPPGRVITKAVTISCVINRTRLMKDLISSIPKPDLPYTFIPIGMATMDGPEVYKKFICINNDRQNEVQGINVKGFSAELFSCYTDATKTQTVMEYFKGQKAISSIQRTLQTEENGKHIFIVYTAGFTEAQALIQDFCTNKFKMIYVSQQQRDDYRVAYKSHPHIVTAAPPGGATAEHSKYLCEMLKQEEAQKGKQYATTSGDTWAAKVKPKFTFDPSSEHPNAAAQPATIAVVNNTTNSTGSINSGSTLAPTAPINSSGQTVVSQDLSSIVSQMQSMQSEQTKALQNMIEKQDRQARRQARAQRQATSAAVRANENMTSMVVDLIRELRGGRNNRTTTKKKSKRPTHRKTIKAAKENNQDNEYNHDIPRKKISKDENTSKKKNQSKTEETKKTAQANTALAIQDEHEDSQKSDEYDNIGTSEHEETALNSEDDDLGSAASDEEDDYASDDQYDSYTDEEEDADVGDDDESSEGSSGNSESDGSSDESTATPPARNKKKKNSSSSAGSKHSSKVATKPADEKPASNKSTSEEPQGQPEEQQQKQSQSEPEESKGYQDDGRLDQYFIPANKSSKKTRMTTAEARSHTKASIAARKKELSERAERKNALRAAQPDQTQMLCNEIPSPGPSTPPAKRERTRRRSPGGTPDNDQKMQRTSTAPMKPSTQDEIARALDYESQEITFNEEASSEPAGEASQPI
jgi:hypothetical protein